MEIILLNVSIDFHYHKLGIVHALGGIPLEIFELFAHFCLVQNVTKQFIFGLIFGFVCERISVACIAFWYSKAIEWYDPLD